MLFPSLSWHKTSNVTMECSSDPLGAGLDLLAEPTSPPSKELHISSACPIPHDIKVSGNTNRAPRNMTTLLYYYWENKQKEKDFPVRRPYSTRFIHSFIFKYLLSSYCVECEMLGTKSYILANFSVTAS